jgi:hypothetical protein
MLFEDQNPKYCPKFSNRFSGDFRHEKQNSCLSQRLKKLRRSQHAGGVPVFCRERVDTG